MKKRDLGLPGEGRELGSGLSRRDFGKLSIGTLGAILPGSRLLAANAGPMPAEESADDLYISADGNDRGAGTRARPFATLERARDQIRSLKRTGKLPQHGITVWLRGGVYRRTQTFKLEAEDSGTQAAPIAYRAYPQEKVTLIGGRRVSGFTPVRDGAILKRIEKPCQDKILQLDLKALGITDYGKLIAHSYGSPIRPAPLELFFQDRPMTIARWPNTGWAKVGPIPRGGENDDSFPYEGDHPLRWRGLSDVWLHGYWHWDWADTYQKVKSIDTKKHCIETYPIDGVRGSGFKSGQRYYALNILEELDAPGEYYLDPNSGILYFWPPAPLATGETYVSLFDQPLVEIREASHLTIRGLGFEYTRGSGIEISGGSNNLVAGCLLRNLGTFAVKIEGGRAHGVRSCDISETGEGGVLIEGGDRKTLKPARHYAVNNRFSRYSRWTRTYRPAVRIAGVGNRVAHNLIYDAPHAAILLAGNNHRIEFNEIHHVALETSDVGGIYMGRDYTQRGNIIRYNYLHDLPTETDANAIYLDDCWSGTTVYGNVVHTARRGVLLGGGRDNTIDNNVFIDCHPAMFVDARGLGWAHFWFDGRNPNLLDRLKEVPYNKPPYSVEYPQLANLLQDDPALPKGNSITHNVCSGGQWLQLLDGLTTKVVKIENNYLGPDPKFVDSAHKNFQLSEDSPAYQVGFKRIPMEKIGIYPDEDRTVTKPDSSGA